MAIREGGFLTVVAALAVTAAWGADTDFVSLFDGKSLGGWTAEHTDRFSVRDGVIFSDGGTGWLRSAKAYKNYELQAEYRALKKGGDSGIFFRATAESSAEAPHWPLKGYQLQILDGPGNLQIFGHGTAPPKYDRKTADLTSVMKGAGEWQSLALKVVGGHAEVSLNGKLISTSDAIQLPEGHIGLQGENSQFEWRNLKIKVLSAP